MTLVDTFSLRSGDEQLLSATSATLAPRAYELARSYFGDIITYSPKVFVPLTKLCRDRCGYCTFAQPPAHLPSPFMSMDEVLEIVNEGQRFGCTEVLLTLGERPELRYDEAARWLAGRGFRSTVDYVAEVARTVLHTTGLLPHANAGALFRHEFALLRQVTASQGMMLESLTDLEAHRLAPDKTPLRRMASLRAAGELQIPFTTGLLVGIGESRIDRLATLHHIADLHREFGHVQEVIVQNFLPKPKTKMAGWPAADDEEFRWTIATARLLLPDDVHLQAPPNLSTQPGELVRYGIDDFGGISPVTKDHVNPERCWPAIDSLRTQVAEFDLHLEPRLTVYPAFQSTRFLDDSVQPHVLALSDANGLGRAGTWVSGSELTDPPEHGVTSSRRFQDLLRRYEIGYEFTHTELVALFNARGRDVDALADLANGVRQEISGPDVTYVNNRNINYTNVCTFKCRFCAFSKGPLSLNLRGDPYLLSVEEITRRVREAEELGATEVCLQGGIHPSFDGDYYVDVLRAVRAGSSSIHVHAFSALEVYEGARRAGQPLDVYLTRLREQGLRTLPGTAAEILDDEVRAVLCPDKINTEQWLQVHEAAHGVGLRSNITIMFGAVEGPTHWANHLLRTKELQARTGGFTEFVPLPFVHMATPLFLRGRARKGPTFREALLMHAVARLHYARLVPNIQVSWVKMGVEGSRRILSAGANDVGGTLMDENISRAAGAEHGQNMDTSALENLVAPLGRKLVQRNTLYNRI